MSPARELVLGRIPAMACLKAQRRRPLRLVVQAGAEGLDALRAAARGVPLEEAPRSVLDRIARGQLHQGVVLEAEALPVWDLKAWLARGAADDAVVVALDSLEDPQNFGGIIRSAAALGAAAVLFGKDRAAPLSAAAVKASAGGVEYIDLIQAGNLVRCLGQLKDAGFWVAGLAAEGAKTLWDADLGGRCALVVGSEGSGMRRLVRETCDLLVRIPIAGPVSSLNAAASATAALVECRRQRAPEGATR